MMAQKTKKKGKNDEPTSEEAAAFKKQMELMLRAIHERRMTKEMMEIYEALFKELITVSEAAEIRNTSRVSIHELIDRGRLFAMNVGNSKLVLRSEVENFEREKPGPKSTRDEK